MMEVKNQGGTIKAGKVLRVAAAALATVLSSGCGESPEQTRADTAKWLKETVTLPVSPSFGKLVYQRSQQFDKDCGPLFKKDETVDWQSLKKRLDTLITAPTGTEEFTTLGIAGLGGANGIGAINAALVEVVKQQYPDGNLPTDPEKRKTVESIEQAARALNGLSFTVKNTGEAYLTIYGRQNAWFKDIVAGVEAILKTGH